MAALVNKDMLKIIRERLKRKEVLSKILLTIDVCSIGLIVLKMISTIRKSSEQNEMKHRFYEEKMFKID